MAKLLIKMEETRSLMAGTGANLVILEKGPIEYGQDETGCCWLNLGSNKKYADE